MVTKRVSEDRTKGGQRFEKPRERREATGPKHVRKKLAKGADPLAYIVDMTEHKQMEEKLNALHRHASQLSSATTADEITKCTLDAMEFTLGFDHADFCVVRNGSIYIEKSRGMPMVVTELPATGPSVIAKAARTREAFLVPDTRKEPAFLDAPATGPRGEILHMLSELTVPVLIADETVAVLNVENTHANAFTERDRMLLEILTEHVASAIVRLRQSEKLEKLVTALRESESHYRTLFDNASDAILIHDMGGRFLEVNEVACQRLGYSRRELLRKTPADIDSPEYVATVQQRVETLRKVGHSFAETAQVRRDGKVIPTELSSRIVEYKGKPAVLSIARDISERKNTEEALRLTQFALDHAGDEVLWMGSDARFVYVNEMACRVLGYSRSELLSMTVHDIDPKVPKAVWSAHWKEIKERGSFIFESIHRAKDGSEFPVEIMANFLAFGGREYNCAIVRDITARKLAEDALRRRAEELAALQATVLDITGPHDLTTLLHTIVERAARLLHAPSGGLYLCDPEKQEVRCVVSYNTPSNYIGTTLKYGEGAAGIVAQTGKPLTVHDYRTWQSRASVFEDERPFGPVLAVPMIWQGQVTGVIDVLDNAGSRQFAETDQELLTLLADHAAIAVENARLLEQARRHAEELKRYSTDLEQLVLERTKKLADSEKRFRELAELLPQIVFEVDTQGNFSYLNRVGFVSTGYTQDDLRKGLNAFQMFVTGDRDRARMNAQKILSGEKLGPSEYTLFKRDGSTFPVIIHSTATLVQGKPAGLRGIVIDITEQKQMQERLLKAERFAAIGELAAMVGHDLRNPLTGIGGAAYYLKTKLGAELGSREQEMIEVIEKSIERSDKIVSDLLEYSRESNLELIETDAKSLIADALAHVMAPAGIRIVDSAQNNPRMWVDTSKMLRVFLNLMQNAFDAMPNGGTLIIASKKSGESLHISFTDTGAGMTRETMRQVWSPLFTTKAKGMGLGLPIARRFVEGHGGSISFESQLGKGSTFTVALPIRPKLTETEKK